jgi:hypothetical protein
MERVEYAAPDGALKFFGLNFYKYVAPDGAWSVPCLTQPPPVWVFLDKLF